MLRHRHQGSPCCEEDPRRRHRQLVPAQLSPVFNAPTPSFHRLGFHRYDSEFPVSQPSSAFPPHSLPFCFQLCAQRMLTMMLQDTATASQITQPVPVLAHVQCQRWNSLLRTLSDVSFICRLECLHVGLGATHKVEMCHRCAPLKPLSFRKAFQT